MDRARVFIVALAYLWLSIPTAFAQPQPEVGWWWNPNENGRGFFIESQGGVTYLAGYFYESDGSPVWLIAGGPNADPSFFRGRLQRFSGGQTLLGDYRAPAPAEDAGEVTLRFTDHRTGTLTWPGGTVPIQRMAFGSAPAGFQPDAGLWWSAAESGRGYNLEVQGDTLFVNAFLYDESGAPVWYLSAGKMATPRRYEGPWLRFADGQTIDGTYRPPSPPVEVGRLAIEFLADDEAKFTFTVPDATAARPAAKQFRMIEVRRMFPFPHRYTGTLSYDLERNLPPLFKLTHNIKYNGSLARESAVVEKPQGCSEPEPGTQCKAYVSNGTGPITITYAGHNGVVNCDGSWTSDIGLGPEHIRVDVYANGRYRIQFPGNYPLVWTLLANCKSNLPPYPDFPYPLVVSIDERHAVAFEGALDSSKGVKGSPDTQTVTTQPYEAVNLRYDFTAHSR